MNLQGHRHLYEEGFTYQQPIGASGYKTIECAVWQTKNVSLPER